ncbi:MAG: hypothetical protein JXB13_17825 [Phycisphaerae bacterium]|nr:hypothetical protein [Phycisphaerae bacterium]
MSSAPTWLPVLVLMSDHGGDWQRFIDAVYAIFHRDFIASQPQFEGKWVRCRRDPIYDGKEAGFWHCTSEGRDEAHRTPDLRRCERIAWVRATIENSHDSTIDVWVRNDGRTGLKTHLWFNEKYLVVLGQRKKGERYQLITAFCTDRRHTIEKKREERERCRND